MATSSSRLSYTDCYDALDAALVESRGVRIGFPNEGSARHFRTRLHSARQLHRADNAATYDLGHPLHGHSEYDKLVVKLKEDPQNSVNPWWLYIEPIAQEVKVEPILETAEPEPKPPAPSIKRRV